MNKEDIKNILKTKAYNGLNIIQVINGAMSGRLSRRMSMGMIADIFSKNDFTYYNENEEEGEFSEYDCSVILERFLNGLYGI